VNCLHILVLIDTRMHGDRSLSAPRADAAVILRNRADDERRQFACIRVDAHGVRRIPSFARAGEPGVVARL